MTRLGASLPAEVRAAILDRLADGIRARGLQIPALFALELNRVAMRIMPDRQTFARNQPSVEWKRDCRWPLHRFAISTQARFAVIADRIMTPTLFDRSLSILKRLFSAIPRINFRLKQSKIIILMIRSGLMFAHPVLHEVRR